MLTDEELTTRLGAAFRETVPDLMYAGPVPQVRRGHTGLLATSAVAAAAALVSTPAALQHDEGGSPEGLPSRSPGGHATSGHQATRTLDIGGLHLTFASVDGDLGPLYLAVGNDLTVPPEAEKVDLGLPVDVWFVDDPASGDPQVYVATHDCPDTTDGCDGAPPPMHVYGILAPGWSRQQLMDFLEHPVETQRNMQ